MKVQPPPRFTRATVASCSLVSGRLWILDASSGARANEPQPFGLAPFEGTGDVQEFSPDGAKLAVIKDRSLWLLAYPAGEARHLSIGEVFPLGRSVSWMPDSRHIVAYMFLDGQRSAPHGGHRDRYVTNDLQQSGSSSQSERVAGWLTDRVHHRRRSVETRGGGACRWAGTCARDREPGVVVSVAEP